MERSNGMSPMRAFFVAFVAGLAMLFGGHGAVVAALADAPAERPLA
jgi:hypothetical protein